MLVGICKFCQPSGKHFTVRKTITRVHVAAISARSCHGALLLGPLRIPCTLGRNGRTSLKREGDGKTPRGELVLRQLLYRPDRIRRIKAALGTDALGPGDGWCDAGGDRNYNRPVALPYPAGHEELWRGDGVYDVLGILGWNERPRRRNGGSAIFFHLTSRDGRPTAGCIAIALPDMRRLLPLLGRKTVFVVR